MSTPRSAERPPESPETEPPVDPEDDPAGRIDRSDPDDTASGSR